MAYKEITEPGTYEVRGQVATGDSQWDASNFADFFYDLKKNVATESLKVAGLNGGRVIPKNGLTYTTTIKSVDYKSSDFNGSYPVLGFFAEKYVPIKANDASKLAKLVLDSNDKYTLKTGEQLDLGSGYTLQVKQIDVNGKKVWLEFDKDGQYVDDNIVSTDSGDHIWTCKLDKVYGEDNVPILKVHVNQVFQGAVDSMTQFEGLWLIDYANAMKIDTSSKFGKLNNVGINGPTLTIDNDDTITLTRNSNVEIGQGIYFKVADSDTLRYFPFVTTVIEMNNIQLLPVADFTANPTSGVAPLSVQFTDQSQNVLEGRWDFGDGGISTEQYPTHTYTTAGTYNVNLTVSNAKGISSKIVTVTVLEDNSSSGGSSNGDGSSSGDSSSGSSHSNGGSGGGGGGGSPEPQNNVEIKELSQAFISSGKSVKFDFPQKVTPVVYVSFDSKKTAGKTTTIVEMLKAKSTLVLRFQDIYIIQN